jgi:hypothetical protein
MSQAEPRLADLRLSSPLQAEICRSLGVPRLQHRSETAQLLYVRRARRSLHQRITRQHLRRTRSSALRRTLLAVLLPDDPSWRNGCTLDGRGRLALNADAEHRLTTWMQEHLLLSWVPRKTVADVDSFDKWWICEHQLVLNTEGTKHGSLLTAGEQAFLQGLPRNTRPQPEGITA